MNCRYVFKGIAKKFMELLEFMRYRLKRGKEYRSNLVEVYRIKRIYFNKTFVKEFLKERKKTVGPNGYRIEIFIDDTHGEIDIVGTVTLYRKKKVIDSATLVTKNNDKESEKLIYWRF